MYDPLQLLSMGFSRQEYWSRQPFPSPEDLPDPGIKSGPPALQADSILSEPPGKLLIWKLAFTCRASNTSMGTSSHCCRGSGRTPCRRPTVVRRAQASRPFPALGPHPSHLQLGFVSNDIEGCTLWPQKAWVSRGPVGLGRAHAC